MRDAAIVFKQTQGKVDSAKSAKKYRAEIASFWEYWLGSSFRDLLNRLDKMLKCKNFADLMFPLSLSRANHVAAAKLGR